MQTPSASEFEVLPDVVIRVDDDGWIVDITRAAEVDGSVDVTLPSTSVLLPGLVDTHIHAPQWPQLGVGLDLPLEQWLFEYTFPLEARCVDVDFAQAVWTHMVPTLLAHGTTTAVFYGSIHVDATTALARTCADVGLRALVGRVAMDHPVGTPDWYRDNSASDGIDASARSIKEILELDSPLVEAIVTPRFIPACTDDLLRGLAEVAVSTSLRIQTHCSESDWEHGYVQEHYGMSDTRALDSLGLVRPATTLAHCDHVSGDDLALIRDAQAGVAHCPLSNAYFAQAVFPLRRALDLGVRVGLGTDVAGGAESGLLKQCGHAVTASRYLEDGVDPDLAGSERGVAASRVDMVSAFWTATGGGAELLDMPLGLITAGRRFDAIVVDHAVAESSALTRWDDDDDRRYFEKLVRLSGPADISHVWVGGRQVVGE